MTETANAGLDCGYIHGYDRREQSRLCAQARILEQAVFKGVDFPPCGEILEVGCGVGAQTEILLERFPSVRVTAADKETNQVSRASHHYRRHRFRDRVKFAVADGRDLPFGTADFDGAFLCWVLEHACEPLAILREVRRCLRPGAPLHLNEVFNQLLYVHPCNAAIAEYWKRFNELQLEMGGDPFVGARLGYLLQECGFSQIQVQPSQELWDIRDCRQRRWMLQYWMKLLLSGAPALLEKGRVSPDLVTEMQAEFENAAHQPDGVLFFGWIKAKALA